MRLTKAIRDAIITDVVKAAFDSRREQLRHGLEAAALAAHNRIYEKHLDFINSAPEGALPTDDDITILSVSGHRFCLDYFYHEDFQFRWENRVFKRRFSSQPSFALELNDPLYLLLIKLFQEKDDINSEAKELERELRSVLNSHSSDSSLLRAWPEGRQWILRHCKTDAGLPTVTIDRLNSRLCALIGPQSPTCSEEEKRRFDKTELEILDETIEAEFSQVKDDIVSEEKE